MSARDEQEIPPQTGEGAEADSPLELSPPDWKQSLRRAVKEFKDDRASIISAGMAFYWFLAVFPALLALVGLMGLFNARAATITSVSDAIKTILPGDAARVLTDALAKAGAQSDGAAVVATLVGVGVALWSASAGMAAMQVGLDVAYDVEQDRTFVKKRLVAFELLVATAVLGGAATVLIVFGQPLGDAIRDNLPFGGAFVLVWTIARWGLALAALTALFAAFYYLAPNRDSPHWAWVSPGGILAAAIWLGASLLFSFYVTSFGSYAETYGSIAGVVVLLLWLYLSALAVMVGGELNAELERQSAVMAGDVAPPRPADATPAAGGRREKQSPRRFERQSAQHGPGTAVPTPSTSVASGNGAGDDDRHGDDWDDRERRRLAEEWQALARRS
ncbi:MAG TPA: YihY/virulence factor BrkB family protein [Acidimicrobiales bacterium]|nr:YihY/virulence factor BrkB family protein [Acidimicrobiales bacterium]